MRKFLKKDFNVKMYQNELDKIVYSTSSIRNKVFKIANYMAYDFPKLPYFWGGGHGLTYQEMLGIDKNWGKMQEIKYSGSNIWKKGLKFPYSLDCSGFVSWCLINASFDILSYISGDDGICLNSSEMSQMGTIIKITDKNIMAFVRRGDIAWMEGHVGIVIDINLKAETLTIVHVSGSGEGTNVTTISVLDGIVVKDDLGETNFENIDRLGCRYFTDIILMNY